jgi:hypothetical protein
LTQTARHIEVFGAGEHKLQAVEIGSLNPVGNAAYAKRTESLTKRRRTRDEMGRL